jgi:type I restriction enzyme, S subunit
MTARRFKPYPAYKDSGVEWLGQIPKHWAVSRLKFRSMMKGRLGWQNLRAEEYVTEGPYVVSSEYFENESIVWERCPHVTPERYAMDSAIQLKSNDVLLMKDGAAMGKLAYVDSLPGPACLNSHILLLRPIRQSYVPRYLFFLFASREFQGYVKLNGTGSTFQGISQQAVGEFRAPFAPLDEQHAIAAILDRETAKIDALVARKEQLIELLQEMRAAMITQAVTKGIDPDVSMKDSGIEWLGKIPAHWEIAPLKRYLLSIPGGIKTGPFGSQLLSSEMEAGDVKVYNQRTVIDRDFDSGENFISEEKFRQLVSFAVQPGDILVTTRGTIGRCAIVPDSADKGVLHPCLMRIQQDPSKVLTEFLILLIQDSDLVRTQLSLASNATTIDVIYSDTMREVMVPKPPTDEQRTIVAVVNRKTWRMDRLLAKVRGDIEKLKEYRTALISAAVTGKIDVREEVA